MIEGDMITVGVNQVEELSRPEELHLTRRHQSML